MRTLRTTRRDQVLAALADRQHGVVSRRQLLASGLSADTIGRAVRARRLRRLFAGVYAVGHAALAREGWWQAGLLAAGLGAALGHRTAGALWHMLTAETFLPVEVIAAGQRGRKQPGIVTRRVELPESDVMVCDRLRVTCPARTIVDLASVLTPRTLRYAVERAQDHDRFDADEIAALLARDPGRRGTPPLRDLIAMLQPDADGARSHLERLFRRVVRGARVPRPDGNEPIAGLSRDFVWRPQRLVVEVDGYRYHSSRAALRRDRRRDRELTALGWRPVRFTYEDVAFEPISVARELATLLDSRPAYFPA